jgi:hypothetical protein
MPPDDPPAPYRGRWPTLPVPSTCNACWSPTTSVRRPSHAAAATCKGAEAVRLGGTGAAEPALC